MTKHDRTHRLRFLLLKIFAASTLLAASSIHAANGTWNVNANGLWSTASNWTNNTIANDLTGTASFTNNITADRTVSLDSDRTINRVNFGDSDTATAGSWILDNNGTATNNLTLSGNTGAATGTVPGIDVAALGTGKTATISAIIEGSYGFTKTSTGTLILTGNNTFSGAVLINSNGGTVIAGHNNALGTASISLNSNTLLVIQDGIAINNSLTANDQGNFKGLTLLSGATSATYSGNISILETTATNFDINVATGGTLTISGSISGNSFEKVGAGTVIVAGVNTYGSTTITGGIVAFANKAAKSAGTATAGAAGSVGLGVKASDAAYYSATDVGNLFNTTLTGFSLNAASGVAIDTTNAGTDFDQTVALTAARALTKLGTGTLILSQANTHTGNTTISGGILAAATSTALGSGSVSIGSGASLRLDPGAIVNNAITTTSTGSILFAGGGLQRTSSQALSTVAQLVAGGTGASVALDPALAWSARIAGVTYSDVLDLTNTHGAIQILQMTYDDSLLVGGSESDIGLGWNSSGNWVNAIDGNIGSSGGSALANASGSYASLGILSTADYLGSWGRDTTANTVWAVVNHNSEYGAIIVVPEPGTLSLAGVGLALVCWTAARRRGRSAR